jgi:hypothetical protein
VGVEADLGLFGVEDFEDLLLVGFGVAIDGGLIERGPSDVTSGGIADASGHVADEKDNRVAQILEVLHLAQEDGVAQVKVRSGGIEAGFDA